MHMKEYSVIVFFLCMLSSFLTNSCATAIEEGYDLKPALLNYTDERNYTYSPSWFVSALHHMPHLNEFAIDHETKFQGGNNDNSEAYYKSLIGFPILMAILSILCIILLQLFMFGHLEKYFPFDRPGPVPLHRDDETRAGIAIWTNSIETSRKFWVTLFLGSLTAVLLGSHLMFIGNFWLSEGVINIDKGARDVEMRVFNVGNDVLDIQEKVRQTDGFITDSYDDCSYSPLLNRDVEENDAGLPPMTTLDNTLINFENDVVVHGHYASDFRKELYKYDTKKDAMIFSFYSVAMVLIMCFVSCFLAKNENYMTVTIVAAQVVLAGLVTLMTIEFIILVALGDFCMDPTSSVVSSMKDDSEVQKSVQYYSVCQGVNPLHTALSESYLARDFLGTAINIELRDGVCQDDPNLMNAMRALSNMHVHFEWIGDELNCDQLHQVWVMTFERALCTDTIAGFFWVWVSQFTTLLALSLVCLSGSVMMLYFENYWDISATVEFKLDNVSKFAFIERYGGEISVDDGIDNISELIDVSESGSIQSEEIAPKEYIPVSTQVPFRSGS